ncbi:hypothetical protein [uncultured Methanobrevibacter sp.]|uniref:hypothetical protein n=1 Tax=uncultured Methanobrevibacter sp. TaxID=253161 RepID=UPI00262FA2FE|nr:hypothetical protein [uncultured Methanobrevibacter sp.]
MVLGVTMSIVKEIKSIDLSSYTLIMTGIAVLFSILSALVLTIGIGIISPGNIGIAVFIIPTIIVGTFMYTIYNSFSQGLFYNLLSTKLNAIKFTLDENQIVKISPNETATMLAVIATIQVLLLYLVTVFILPLVLNATIQTLMFGGQELLAYELYQFLILINQPMTIILFIFGTFVITFVFTLIGVYIYNILAKKGKAITVELSNENEMTALDSIDLMSLAIAVAIINGILTLIFAIIMLISGGNIATLLTNVISSIITGFIEAALFAIFYNFLAPKIGKLKLELIDQ